ncbi:MAG: transglutaminase-like domain-containing protein [Rikenellaceae bacterium]|nr:transglutaminase-like domain-containing protein [Rikenellaceae bacterium]
MKRIMLLLAFAVLMTVQVAGQEYVRPTLAQLEDKIEEYNQKMIAAVEQERYADAVEALTELNTLLDYHLESDPDHWQSYRWHFDYVRGYNYYNIACYESLGGNIPQALDAFEKAYEYGYYGYRWALEDSDLEAVREEPRFRETIEKMRGKGDYLALLQRSGPYLTEDTTGYPAFQYEPATAGRLHNVRRYLGLDTVAVGGSETERIIALMSHIHNIIPHDGSHRAYCENTAIDLYNYSKANGGRGINCRQLAIVLNECYLSMGFPSRYVTCFPENIHDNDCHVICSVWSNELGKWLWMDPSFNAYVTDENGELLGIAEVRERMRDGRPYSLNEDANHNNNTPQTKEQYLDEYMAKNLYWLQVPVRSALGVESPYFRRDTKYIGLVPEGYINPEYVGENFLNTSDAEYF